MRLSQVPLSVNMVKSGRYLLKRLSRRKWACAGGWITLSWQRKYHKPNLVYSLYNMTFTNSLGQLDIDNIEELNDNDKIELL